jgi:cell division protein FtsB
MSRTHNSVIRDDLVEATATMIRAAMADLRRDGRKGTDAIAETARRFGLTPRRVKSYLYGEIWTCALDVLQREADLVRDRFAEHLQCELFEQDARIAKLRARRATLEAARGIKRVGRAANERRMDGCLDSCPGRG